MNRALFLLFVIEGLLRSIFGLLGGNTAARPCTKAIRAWRTFSTMVF